jgi:DNA-binding Lrp family transcriptional regulator
MITAIILIQTERTQVTLIAEQLVDMDGIAEVYSVSGAYSLVAIVRVRSTEDLASLVTTQLVKIDAITRTETMLAFRAFSRHDVESMFLLGE